MIFSHSTPLVRGTAYTGVGTVLACAVGSASHTGKTIKKQPQSFWKSTKSSYINYTLFLYLSEIKLQSWRICANEKPTFLKRAPHWSRV